MPRRNERGNAGAGCLLLIIIVALLALMGSCMTGDDDDEWCQSVEDFWADGNQYDSGPLVDDYAMQC